MEVNWTAIHTTWISIAIIRWLLNSLFHFKIDVVFGTTVYGIVLIAIRALKAVFRFAKKIAKIRKTAPRVTMQEPPVNVLDFNSAYRLTGTTVIAGHNNKRPIRINLDEDHTLIAGTTGAGKTVAINNIMAQLVTRPEHGKSYDLYMIDLKGDAQDNLHKWGPVIAGYYSIDEDGSTLQAIAAIEDIMRKMSKSDGSRRIGVFIDELAMLTEQAPDSQTKRAGEAALRRLTAQLRSKGFLTVATQRPHFQTIPRNISSNLARKICFRVDDLETAQLVLRTPKKPKDDVTSFRDGQFLMIHKGKKSIGQTMFVSEDDIDKAISQRVEIDTESDVRLKLFAFVANGLRKHAQLPGINRVTKEFDGLHSKQVEAHYRNFALANAIIPILTKDGKCKGYKLADEYNAAIANIKNFITAGKWQENPLPIGS